MSFPEWLEPMAATLTQDRFTGPEWIFERKFDGIRLLAFRQGPDASLGKTLAGPTGEQVSTSASLIVKSRRFEVEAHVLFDAGWGVTGRLADFGLSRVDVFFNTHSHLDHIAEADRILGAQKSILGGRAKPLFYSTEETWKRGVGWAFPWLSEAVDLRMLNGCVAANAPVRPLDGLGIGLKVTPVPVYHGDLADQPVIYVVEFGSGETCVKIVLAWDLLHLVTRHPEPAGVEPAPGWGPEVCSDRPACPAGIVRLLGR